jgi:hypothetical protein
MFKKFVIATMLAVSFSAMANSMAQELKDKGFDVSSDPSGSRQRYEKQSRVRYPHEAKAAKAAEVAEADETETPTPEATPETTETTKEPAKKGPRSQFKGRSGAMRF